MNPSQTMREFAVGKILALMDDLLSAMKHAVDAPDEEAVHKVRVAIRRFQQALRLFRQYLKASGVERVKAKLHAIMQIAGELRNRDIAIALTKDAGANTIVLADQRAEFDRQFTALVRPLTYPGLGDKWRRQLGLDNA
jgi:CHAD domain-containing protein